jgi:hypothetical protein
MKRVELASVTDRVAELRTLYGNFDLGPDGRPPETWERKNLKSLRLERQLRSPWFPDFWFYRVLVNRRMVEPISAVLREINVRWTPEAQEAHGLNQFVKCYCFGDGLAPSLFWYGAAWRLSEQVGGETLSEVSKVFTRHGFTQVGLTDKRRVRDFEYW